MKLSPQQAQQLAQAPVGHLSTAGRDAAPHVIPVCFALDDPESRPRIYIVLDRKPKRAALTRLRRVRNILENPQAALVVDHYDADWSELWYILLTGKAQLLEGDSETAPPEPVAERPESGERRRAIRLLRHKYPQYRDMDIAENPVIKLTPQRIVAWSSTPA